MIVNGAEVAEGRLPKAIPTHILPGEGMASGMDVGWLVDLFTSCPSSLQGTSTRSRPEFTGPRWLAVGSVSRLPHQRRHAQAATLVSLVVRVMAQRS
jgi:hypothetical protein